MTPLDALAASAVVVIWAFNFIAGKIGLTQLPALLMIGLRFALVALLLAPFLRSPGKPWRSILILSVVFGGLHFGLLFSGLQGVGAGVAAIAGQLTAPFSAVLAAIFYGERMNAWQMAGMAVAFFGVWLFAGEPTAIASVSHLLMVIAGALAWSVANILIKRLGSVNVFVLNAWIALLAFPQLLMASFLFEDGQWQALVAADWQGFAAIAYMAVGASITAYGLWYYLIEKHEMNRIVPLSLLAPVLAVFLAVLILAEPLTPRIVVGGLLTVAGVAMIQFLRRDRPLPEV